MALNAVKGKTLNSTSIGNAYIFKPESTDVAKFEKVFTEIQSKKDELKIQNKNLEKQKNDLITKYFR